MASDGLRRILFGKTTWNMVIFREKSRDFKKLLKTVSSLSIRLFTALKYGANDKPRFARMVNAGGRDS